MHAMWCLCISPLRCFALICVVKPGSLLESSAFFLKNLQPYPASAPGGEAGFLERKPRFRPPGLPGGSRIYPCSGRVGYKPGKRSVKKL